MQFTMHGALDSGHWAPCVVYSSAHCTDWCTAVHTAPVCNSAQRDSQLQCTFAACPNEGTIVSTASYSPLIILIHFLLHFFTLASGNPKNMQCLIWLQKDERPEIVGGLQLSNYCTRQKLSAHCIVIILIAKLHLTQLHHHNQQQLFEKEEVKEMKLSNMFKT